MLDYRLRPCTSAITPVPTTTRTITTASASKYQSLTSMADLLQASQEHVNSSRGRLNATNCIDVDELEEWHEHIMSVSRILIIEIPDKYLSCSLAQLSENANATNRECDNVQHSVVMLR